MFSLRRFNAVAKKEFLEIKRNKLFFVLTVLAPIILYFLFAYGFPLSSKHIPTGVVDLDKSAKSRMLIDTFSCATDLFNIKMVGSTYAPLEREMDLGNLRQIIVVPSGFSKDILRSKPVTVQVLIDGTYPNMANINSAYVEAIITAFRMQVLQEYFLKKLGSQGAVYMPIDVMVSGWYNPSFRSEDFILPGIIAMVLMFFPPMVGAVSLAKEKETGSILNMYCSRITKTEYLLGKMFPYVVISYINFALFFVLSIFLFNVPMRGSIVLVLIVSFFFVATAIAVGLLVAVLVSTQVAAILITTVVTLTPSFLYSGFMVPVQSISQNSRWMCYSLPATYYIDFMRKIMVKGATFAYVRLDTIAIIIFCIGIYVLCIKLFKKRVG
ncbi:MAG: ABC transporter permease [Candidatus Ancaeobacter aquaticus]|nr:ABC transporter permease [Candidatus Ancaeobacter aquaticus]